MSDDRPRGDDRADEGNAGAAGASLLGRSLATAVRADSWLLRSYGVVAGLLLAAVVAFVVVALPTWVAATVGESQQVAFSRAFLLLAGLLVAAPLVAPAAFAARRRAAGVGRRRHEFLFALSGYAFVGSLYAAVLASAPPDLRESPPAALAPVVDPLYAAPPTLAPVLPVVAAAAVLALDRLLPRRRAGAAGEDGGEGESEADGGDDPVSGAG